MYILIRSVSIYHKCCVMDAIVLLIQILSFWWLIACLIYVGGFCYKYCFNHKMIVYSFVKFMVFDFYLFSVIILEMSWMWTLFNHRHHEYWLHESTCEACKLWHNWSPTGRTRDTSLVGIYLNNFPLELWLCLMFDHPLTQGDFKNSSIYTN